MSHPTNRPVPTTPTIDPAASPDQSTTLRPGAIGFPAVLFQSIAMMAPAGAVAFSLGAAIPFTGGALPLAVLVALLACVLISLNIGMLAKHLPSAGGYFTYVSHGLGPQAGWLTGWLFGFTYMVFAPTALMVGGAVTDAFMSGTLHLSLGPHGWVVYSLLFTAIAFGLTLFGIKISADTGVVLGAIEVGVFVLLSVALIVHAGGDNTLAAFNPATSPQHGLGGWHGVLYGMLFAFLAFGGFESAAILGEESHNPRRTVPRAILFATIGIGVFYVFCSYAGVVGWGFGKIATYPGDPNPWGTMAGRVWGRFAFLVIFAILNSQLGNAIAAINAGARMLFAMGRIHALPAALGQSNRRRAPSTAMFVLLAVAVVVMLTVGLSLGPIGGFALLGACGTVPILLVYIATCVSVPFFYLREHRTEFRVLPHAILPAVPVVLLTGVIYLQFVPTPAAPLNLVGPINLAWLVLGIILVTRLTIRSPEVLAEGHQLFAAEGSDSE